MAQDKFSIISEGLKIACSKKLLSPLLRSIELCLDSNQDTPRDTATIFSCDSFCEPHLNTQLDLWKCLGKSLDLNLTFFNYPVGHYISSVPDLEVLSYAGCSTRLLAINQHLIDQQSSYKATVDVNRRIDICKLISEYSKVFDSLSHVTNDSEWEDLTIKGFPFHELSYRDLSLTYKCLPSLCVKQSDRYHQHFIYMNKSILHQLLLLCLNSHMIGGLTFYMSDYTASSVFKHFCSLSGRTSRFFDKISLPHEVKNSIISCNIRILETANDGFYLTNLPHALVLSHANSDLSNRQNWMQYIDYRMNGQDSHVYSSGIKANDTEIQDTDVLSWIDNELANGKKVVSMFTSSPDELVGQQIAFSHAKIDFSHLSRPIFQDQDDWVSQTIQHFSEKSASASLLVRFHPRLAADHRGLPEAPYFEEYFRKLSNLCNSRHNIRLVSPSCRVSSYLIGCKSSFVLNGWSTIGLELAAKGHKVINAFIRCTLGASPFYPVHLNLPQFSSQAQYYSYVDQLLLNTDANSYLLMNPEEALKSFVAFYLRGATDLNNINEVLSQIARPQILTPTLLKAL